jgi:hypothetical protein
VERVIIMDTAYGMGLDELPPYVEVGFYSKTTSDLRVEV